jgi:hypothetical protein
LPSRLHWFETEVLSQAENLDGLSRLNRELLAKAEAMDVKHARYYWLLLAEGHLTRRRFGAMLGRTALLPVPTG